jgi:hypothetical protein
MFNEDNDLSEQERTMLAALPREMAPSDLLEERVVRALKNQGHFGTVARASRPWGRIALRAAAAVLLFVGGVATGKYMLAQPSPAVTTSAASSQQANVKPTEQPRVNSGAQSVKNNETVVAQREMWL